ncbi:hypothetical protein GCM10025767_34100 [Thalassotalea piscium]|uniref:Uncharacterized protein n=1 Tax=Thalassotalea piscium TaxID=1230533 RepID=A0A7X0NGM7_9GAMM|nr:hypothetical protein [Thalassotalea piscium]
MFKKNKKQKHISVSLLSRYWDNPDGFEYFLQKTPNKFAIKEGEKFHRIAAFITIPPFLLAILATSLVMYVLYTHFYNS